MISIKAVLLFAYFGLTNGQFDCVEEGGSCIDWDETCDGQIDDTLICGGPPTMSCCIANTRTASSKKGICVAPRDYLCDDLAQFSGISWWYDWSLRPAYESNTNCTNTPSQERVAMQWGQWNIDTIAANLPAGTRYILGFNEPNHKAQANMEPEFAAQKWREMEANLNGSDVILISPSASDCNSGPERCVTDTVDWFNRFFAACSDCRVDHLATHYYACNADWTMSHIRGLHDRYARGRWASMKVWLTEFACPGATSIDQVLAYMQTMIDRLEAADFVDKYSWYNSRLNDWVGKLNQLLEDGVSQLSQTGEFWDTYLPAYMRK